MKKLFYVIMCLLLLIYLLFSTTFTVEVTMPLPEETAEKIFANYNNGAFGDELYYLASDSVGDDINDDGTGVDDVAIYKTGSSAQIIFYQSDNRSKKRQLTNDELLTFEAFITGNSVDELPDWNEIIAAGGTEYQYMHFTKDSRSTLYMFNPGILSLLEADHSEHGTSDPFPFDRELINKEKTYTNLVAAFQALEEVGEFDISYDLENIRGYHKNDQLSNKDAKILIKNEDHFVKSVWKDGDDFRVLIKDMENSKYDHEVLNWFSFKNGVVGPQTAAPVNNHPRPTQWGAYFVRILPDPPSNTDGLWLTKEGEEPQLISEGNYAHPVVIPGTDWVVCAKAAQGWESPNLIVRINLSTLEETVIDLPPAHWLYPLCYLNNKLVIFRRFDDSLAEYYLYDAQNENLERVKGDFNRVGDLAENFLQPTSEPDQYFMFNDQHSIGIFNTNTYRLTNITKTSLFIQDHSHVWVDTAQGIIYIAINGDLVELQLKLE